MKGEYYQTSYSRKSQTPRRSVVMWCVDLLLTLLSVVTTVAMLLTYLVPHLSPERLWFLPVLGLAAPCLYLLTVILALYWLLRWRLLRAGLMLVVVVIGLSHISLFWRPEQPSHLDRVANQRATFTVMSYNVRSFYGEDDKNSADSIVRLIDTFRPDIICLQEFNTRLAEQSEAYLRMEEGYHRATLARGSKEEPVASSMVILSKFKIIRSGVVLSPHTSVWADIEMGRSRDTVRIINNHLRSTAINADDNDYLSSHRYLADSAREEKLLNMVERHRANSLLRAQQADSLAEFLRQSPRRRLVCGDFNDTPSSYVYHTISEGLEDSFSRCGSGYSHTFRGFFDLLRIDYILSSPDLEPLTYQTPKVPYSDHYPLYVVLKKHTLTH